MRHFRDAGLLVDRRRGYTLYVALNKGGACKLFKDDQLLLSDTQFSLRVSRQNKLGTVVGHLVDEYDTKVGDDEIFIAGALGWAKQSVMTTPKLIMLRLLMIFGGRLFPNLIRSLLQKLLIVGKQKAPFNFKRWFKFEDGRWIIKDELTAAKGWDQVRSVGLGVDQTSIYVVMSRTFQSGQMAPWKELGKQKPAEGEPLILERKF